MSQEQLIKDIHDRIDAEVAKRTGEQSHAIEELKALMQPENLRTFVSTYLSELTDDDPIVRKMRFGGEKQQDLIGSKFARFGLDVADIEYLYDMQHSLRGQKKIDSGFYTGPSEQLENTFKALSSAYYLSEDEVREIDRRALDGVFPRVPKHELRGLNREQWVERQMRAMDTAESGYGSQLIGAQYVGDLWEVSRSLGVIAPLFRSFEMSDPTAYLPVEVDFPEMYFVSESTANNSSNYSTSKTGSQRVSVAAKKMLLHQMWSGEMEEDSIIPFIPFLRAQAAKALAFYTDSAILNGDDTNSATGNINLDDADPADTKHYLAFDGIRHAAIVDNTANGLDVAGPVTLNTFKQIRALMRDTTRYVDWGHPLNRNDLVFIADPDTSDNIDLLDEVVNAKLMSGNSADLLNGQTASILGHPVIRTMVMSKTEADGKLSTTGSNNTKGQITAVNTTGGVVGWRRRVKFETERLPATDQTRLVYSLRLGFGRFTPTGAASGIEWTATGYDITV